ncbi:MAG: DUF3800 domain-containing protein [Bacteroidales bacterium]|nr:DUF3800 domain-containing protein [Bacteroidales bacterium]
MEQVLAYIDESGDPRFNEGSSSHLEYSSILIDSTKKDEIQSELENVLSTLKLSEFKSKDLDEKRRLKILELIQEIDFKYINLSIDKSKVIGDWRIYPRTFYKYTQNILHNELHRLFPNKIVTIDKFGNDNYQQSLKKYLEEDYIQLVIFENVINIGSAKNNIFIQLADLIAGTHRKLIKGEFERIELFQEILSKKELNVIKWPDNYSKFILTSVGNKDDQKIAEISISYAERYVDTNRNLPGFRARILVLEYLLFQLKYKNFRSFIYSTELMSWLNQNNIKLSEEDFRKEVIGKLREEGVVIASSRKGLKIPISNEELVEYINYCTSKYLKIIKRLRETYKTLNASSLGSIEVFNSREFEINKDIFNLLDKY